MLRALKPAGRLEVLDAGRSVQGIGHRARHVRRAARERLKYLARRVVKRVRADWIAEDVPPEGRVSAGPEHFGDLAQADRGPDPVKRGGRRDEIEVSGWQRRLFEGL